MAVYFLPLIQSNDVPMSSSLIFAWCVFFIDTSRVWKACFCASLWTLRVQQPKRFIHRLGGFSQIVSARHEGMFTTTEIHKEGGEVKEDGISTNNEQHWLCAF